jgi:hypothetical protein
VRGRGAARGAGREAARGRRRGEGGEREKGRGREIHLGDPNFGDHRLQTLGHHGGREREVEEGEGGYCAGEIK